MVYITGDTHGDFIRIEEFCAEYGTTKEDILIILGDVGINYYLNQFDDHQKAYLEDNLPIILFCIHGNHEERPFMIDTYKECSWSGGTAYIEEQYPSIIFAKDGEIYDFGGKKAVAIGGAYSVDKYYRLSGGGKWFPTEQPDDEIMDYVERNLAENNWRVDYVFSHTCPKRHEPTDLFLESIDQSTIDKTTEKWLDTIEDRLDFERWYFGHFHENREDGEFTMLFEDIIELE